jgi:acyl-homoserine lactone acylase PvdQ
VPGSPIILIGFTDRVAWGVTALGADQADLFQLETDPARPDQYRFDNQWRPMTVYSCLRTRSAMSSAYTGDARGCEPPAW